MPLFGAPQGISQAIGDTQTLGQIAMQPDRAALLHAQVDKAQLELSGEQKMAALIAGSAQQTGKPLSMADKLDQFAQMASDAGLITKAEGFATAAATLRAKEAAAGASKATQVKAQIGAIRERANLVGQIMGGVNDQQSWDRAQALWTFQTGMPSPYAGVPYSPQLVESIKNNAISALDKAKLLEKETADRAEVDYKNTRLKQINTNLAISRSRLKLEQEREARLAKTGGKATGSPNQAEVDQAALIIQRDNPYLADIDLNDAAFNVAAAAKELRAKNPALSAAMAIQQAYNEAQADGDFMPSGGFDLPILGHIGDKGGFEGGGKTAETAIPVPEKAEDLVPNKYYTNSQGITALWTGKGFKPVSSKRPLSNNNGRP